ncbi:diacylglycerol lipase-alpha [Anopheles bellator]|uniref:diacylglycerol lipase-alpha n=1 Tax=Anopheles bellator TaxID=139047 RepID=UPI0026487537|nr:diacylglycerol lipase-alpha [Anopheles bellator]
MPGIVVFRRRWSVGSDDLVVPGLFLLVIHFIWLAVLLTVTYAFHFDTSAICQQQLLNFQIGYMILLAVCMCVEASICIISMRGSILDTERRASMQYLLYGRLLLMLLELSALTMGIIWLRDNYVSCQTDEPKEVMLAAVSCNLFVVFSMITTIWCTFDPAGRSWVKMKKYQRSMRQSESRFNYKRSGNRSRNWRQRKVIRAYQDSWDHRCRLLFCCMGNSDRSRNSFTDIARLLSDFFRDLDVVPSDVVAGLVLLRKFQKLEREVIVRQQKNGTHKFLSGVPIMASTKFLALHDPNDFNHFQNVIRYMYFAQGAYGWPMYLMSHSSTGICQLASELRYCFCRRNAVDVVDDNCCFCNFAALRKMLELGEVEVLYATYHVDIAETPFFVAIDYNRSKIVVSIRGTLSMKDVLTDLNAEGEPLPVSPAREDFLGHKGMVQAALYIKQKLEEENLIQRALLHNPARGTQNFGLVLVGHSLGAGTAAILAILLKQEYEILHCYSYSPPGGLLSIPAVEYSKSFITSVVVGKDVVPRIGLYQMEALRADLINAIQRSIDPKWKTIACSVICCCCGPEPTSVMMMSTKDSNVQRYKQDRNSARQSTVHPSDNSIALTIHHPLYPPGRIIHIVRHHPMQEEQMLKKREPVYQAIWADNKDFDEVLISPVMIQDHMPDTVLAALEKVVASAGPQKPNRQFTSAAADATSPDVAVRFSTAQLDAPTVSENVQQQNIASPVVPHKICLETSFTDMQLLQLHQSGESPQPLSCDSRLNPVPDVPKASPAADSSVMGMRSVPSSLVDDSGIPQSISGPSEMTTPILGEVQNAGPVSAAVCVPPPLVSTIGGSSAPVRTLNFIASANPTRNDMFLMFQHQAVASASGSAHHTTAHSRSENLSLGMTRRNSYEVQKVDLIHDDWFGMAPLASPESLSELSSISSRASVFGAGVVGCTDRSIEQPQQHRDAGVAADGTASSESQLHTPKVLRRTPKVSGNLSTCAEDARTVYQYKRMGKIFVLDQPSSFDSGTTYDGSFGHESNGSAPEEHSLLLATIREKDLPPTSPSVDAYERGESERPVSWRLPTTTGTDDALSGPGQERCASRCPACPCRSGAVDSEGVLKCCERFNHRECYNFKHTSFNVFKFKQTHDQNGSGGRPDRSGSMVREEPRRAGVPIPAAVATSSQTSTTGAARAGLLESHFPVFSTARTTNGNGGGNHATRQDIGEDPQSTLSCASGDQRGSDTLPLLVNLVEHTSSNGGSGFSRKKYSIHPTEQKVIVMDGFKAANDATGTPEAPATSRSSAVTPKHFQTLAKNESNV